MDIKVTGVRRAVWITLVAMGGIASYGWAASHIQDEIRAIAKQARGRVAIACSLPGVSLDCNFNEHAHPPMQSVFKLPLAMTVLHLAEQGRFTLDQLVHFAGSDRFGMRTISPLQDRYPQGEVDIPIRELTRLTVVESDNVASELLLKFVGGPSVVNDYIASLNVKGFHLLDGELSLHRNPDLQYRNWFEPAGAVRILRLLADHSPLGREDTNLLLGWMGQTSRGANRISGALPPGTMITHKPGSSGTEDGRTAAWNDIGLITLPDGRKMAVAVFITNSTADEQTRDAVIARISKALWDLAVSSR
jgi:beta-lactamase class A